MSDYAFDVDFRVRTEGLSRCLDRLLISRRESTKRVLDSVTQLTEHCVRHVDGILGDEEDADAFRANKSNYLLDSPRYDGG